MPLSPPPRMPSGARGPRRRSLIASAASVVSAAGAVLLVGCSGGADGSDRSGSGAGRGRPSEAERARARAARDSRRLVEHYDAVIAAHPGLGERLTPLRAEIVRHAGALEEGGVSGRDAAGESGGDPVGKAGGEASGDPGGLGARGASPAASGVVVPGDEKEALAGLAGAERVLAEQRAGALLDVPGELARLLASVAAAGAAHVYLLTSEGSEGAG